MTTKTQREANIEVMKDRRRQKHDFGQLAGSDSEITVVSVITPLVHKSQNLKWLRFAFHGVHEEKHRSRHYLVEPGVWGMTAAANVPLHKT